MVDMPLRQISMEPGLLHCWSVGVLPLVGAVSPMPMMAKARMTEVNRGIDLRTPLICVSRWCLLEDRHRQPHKHKKVIPLSVALHCSKLAATASRIYHLRHQKYILQTSTKSSRLVLKGHVAKRIWGSASADLESSACIPKRLG